MRVLHITFRYGKEIYGGAELYLRHISEELVKLGISVDVCTTKTTTLHPLFHSSVLFDNEQSNEQINGVDVYRFSTKNPNKLLSYIFDWLYHRQLDKEEEYRKPQFVDIALNNISNKGGFLLTGWNNIERLHGLVMRWTKKEAIVMITDSRINKIICSIQNPAGLILTLICIFNNQIIIQKTETFSGYKQIELDLPNLSGKIIFKIICNHPIRFCSDFRTLGVSVLGINYCNAEECIKISLENDIRNLLIQSGDYLEYLIKNAQLRPKIFSHFFNYMRGPNSPPMEKWLKDNISKYDVVLAQMFPYNTIKYSLEAKIQSIPLVLLPLMHIDDEFYHWSHYYSYLQKSDMVFALSEDSKDRFYSTLVKTCINVGAGIDQNIFLNPRVSGKRFKEQYHLVANKIILTVSRKNPGKKYDIIVRAMKKIRSVIGNAVLVMIGPDDDNIPLNEKYVHYLGKVEDSTLADAYDACEAFVMMSESESFGMVFCEAWARKKAVIGNKNCGAVSSLIENEIDGLLCSNEEELSDALIRLLSDSNISNTMGKRGYEKVMKSYTWEIVTEKIYSIYKEEMQQNGKSCTI